MTTTDQIRFVIVNYNEEALTEDCLSSLSSAGVPLSQVILVDNGSSLQSHHYLNNKYGGSVSYIRNEVNRGYAAGLNSGIQSVAPDAAEWFFLLNNDTVVSDDILPCLVETIQKFPQFLIFGPLILFMNQPDSVWYLANRHIGRTLLAVNPYRRKRRSEINPEVIATDLISGCAMVVHRSVIDQVGFFDESYFLFGEEVDYLLRARSKGVRFAAAPSIVIWHRVSASTGKKSGLSSYYRIRNQVFLYRRYGTAGLQPLYWVFSLVQAVIRSLSYYWGGGRSSENPHLRGWWDGWNNPLPSRDKVKNDL